MVLPKRQLLSYALLLLAAASLNACGGSGGRVVAHVGSTPIMEASVRHWAALEAAARGRPVSVPDRQAHVKTALGLLIAASQLVGTAAGMHVEVTSKEVEARLSELSWDEARDIPFEPASKHDPFAKLIGHRGETHADRLFLVKLDLLTARVESKLRSDAEAQLSHAEVEAYYAAHKYRYVIPERRDLEVIGNYEKPMIMKAKREVEAGVGFLLVARRLSHDQEAPGGLELNLARGEEEPQYDRVVFSAKPGVLYGPYLQAFYFIFKVIKVKPATQIPAARAEVTVRRQMVAEREGKILSGFQRSMERRWGVRTACQPAYIVPRCRKYAGTAAIEGAGS